MLKDLKQTHQLVPFPEEELKKAWEDVLKAAEKHKAVLRGLAQIDINTGTIKTDVALYKVEELPSKEDGETKAKANNKADKSS